MLKVSFYPPVACKYLRRSTVILLSFLQISLLHADGLIDENASEMVKFTRDIQPIFAESCFACHGPDTSTRQADLRLDDRQAAIDFGAIVPGDSASSPIIARIFSADPELVMPPPESHKVLTATQKDALRRWVDQEAKYEKHWSFEAPTLPAVPEVTEKSWPRNPIDNFVADKLDQKALRPAAAADIQTLVRRVCLDITGLPPLPEEIAEVVADPKPDRYERYVDRLLQRKSWGEHRGRYWLDYARYADTHGIHFDNFREIHAYRDWVIDAFNDNMPFDQFTIEQLGGDLLPNATLNQQIATGFQRCNITTNEGGIIDEEYVVLYARDRVETAAAVWMGLTVGCAVCHDHKFDPISQKEFYQLTAFFNNTTQAPRDGNIKDTPPIVVVPQLDQRAQYSQSKIELLRLTTRRDQLKQAREEEFTKWQSSTRAARDFESQRKSVRAGETKIDLHIPLTNVSGRSIAFTLGDSEIQSKLLPEMATAIGGVVGDKAWVNQSQQQVQWPEAGDFEQDAAFSVAMWVRLSGANSNNGAIVSRMDNANKYRGWDVWLEGNKIGMHLINAWPENAAKVVSEKSLPLDAWTHVVMSYDGSTKADGFRCWIDGQASKLKINNDTLTGTTRTDVPFKLNGRNTSDFTPHVGIQDIRLYSGVLSERYTQSLASDVEAAYLASKLTNQLNETQRARLYNYYLANFDSEFMSVTDELQTVQGKIDTIAANGTIAHVMAERDSIPTAYLLNRGEYDQRRDELHPETPAILPTMHQSLPQNRLGFAKWLVSDDHPLTARVTVNRCWQELFGRGLVATAGDFGVTGELPSHPELLDYLAIDFRSHGWDIKRLYRQMVTSATYQQLQNVTPEKLEIDPDNRFLSRGPRFRMDAEMVRDYALTVSGLLNPAIGGRSVRPYQPEGVWEAVAMPESNTRNYKLDDTPMLYRRSMYTFWKRSAPPASMDIFNAPSRETCAVKRERTNTPLQALVTMNDPQYIEANRVLAGRVLLDDYLTDDAARIQAIAMRVIGRHFTDGEIKIVQSTLNTAMEYYASHSADAEALLQIGATEKQFSDRSSHHAAWTLVVNQIMNLDEALCK